MDRATRLEILELKRRLLEAEQKLSQFYDMQLERQKADIDYIAMEAGVDLEQSEESEVPNAE